MGTLPVVTTLHKSRGINTVMSSVDSLQKMHGLHQTSTEDSRGCSLHKIIRLRYIWGMIFGEMRTFLHVRSTGCAMSESNESLTMRPASPCTKIRSHLEPFSWVISPGNSGAEFP